MKEEFIVDANNCNLRLDNFVLLKMPELSRSHIKNLIENGKVTCNGKTVKAGEKIKTGYKILVDDTEVKTLDLSPQDIPIDIVYEDDDLAIINKPKGMVVHPASGNYSNTLVNALLFRLKSLSTINGVVRPGIVHRLDKDTSGLLVVAKNDKSHISLAKQIQDKTCHRYYLALCTGNIKDDEGRIETGFGRHPKNRKQMSTFNVGVGKLAITNYKVLKRYKKYTLVEFKLDTGRTHQIRVHSKSIGHPIVGDETYGTKSNEFKTNGQLLHAYKLELTHPTTNKAITFTCDLPQDFALALKKLDATLKQ